MKFGWVGALAVSMCLAAGAASAAPVTYMVDGTFNYQGSSGTYSGTFSFDAVTNVYSGVDIWTTAGRANDGVSTLPPARLIFAQGSQPHTVAFTELAGGTGGQGLVLFFSPTLAQASPRVALAVNGICSNANCSGFGPVWRDGTAPGALLWLAGPLPIPTLSEWAALLFALMLAGGGALMLRRRSASL